MLAALIFYVGAALVLVAGAASALLPGSDLAGADHVRATLRAIWRARRDLVRDPVIRGAVAGVLLGAVPLVSARAIPGPAGLLAAAGVLVAMRRVRQDQDRRRALLGWAVGLVVWSVPSLVFVRL
jgi:hypothetical protein